MIIITPDRVLTQSFSALITRPIIDNRTKLQQNRTIHDLTILNIQILTFIFFDIS